MAEEEIKRSDVMARRWALIDEIATVQAEQAKTLEPLTQELAMCEAFIKQTMLDAHEQQVKIKGVGMAFFTPKDRVTVEDMGSVIRVILNHAPAPAGWPTETWQFVLSHVEDSAMWGLLNKAVNKTAAKELIEARGKELAKYAAEHPDAPPSTEPPLPGVKYESFRDLAWRRET